jgi:hypothetical protein
MILRSTVVLPAEVRFNRGSSGNATSLYAMAMIGQSERNSKRSTSRQANHGILEQVGRTQWVPRKVR